MIETTNTQTTESILDSTWINAQSKHSTACIMPCFLNFRPCLCLGDVAMAAAREISPTQRVQTSQDAGTTKKTKQCKHDESYAAFEGYRPTALQETQHHPHQSTPTRNSLLWYL